MISTALDNIPAPPSSKLLGWHLLDARPKEGWIRIGFDGKRDFCNPAGFVQGGILSAMLDDTMGPAVFTMTGGIHHNSDRVTIYGGAEVFFFDVHVGLIVAQLHIAKA